ncbi:hypothetical protein V476_25540 [Pseudomonas syringae KCTC 12500]|uniref:hypothetical protein n=1 Tax=Pseudomonas syringae TaxID=317 RepID=UPI00046832DC|nr:hypothetical protein [Pseudomonas syringae]KMY04299.1 hypothetical protein V476_25540 [Pseudomonas syringae KCTC 12500]KWS95950.1 hypothetical protein AL048_19545 [Pseudomonas syringae pv. castaneae]POR87609.1 hypothetical protein BKM21_02960 [Pseudomonas syringae pv. syringae]
MDAAWGVVLGAAIGATSSFGAMWLQAHYQSKRERAKTILDLAIRHRSEAFQYADKITGPISVSPLAVHVHFQDQLLRLVEEGSLTPESLERLHVDNSLLEKVIRESKLKRVTEEVIQARSGG